RPWPRTSASGSGWRRRPPDSEARPGGEGFGRSGEAEEQLLELLAVQVAVRRGQTLLHPAGDDGESGAVHGLGDGRELGDHVLAVPTLLEHAGDGGELPLGALEAVDDGSHVLTVQFHASSCDATGRCPSYTPWGVLHTPGGICD